MDELLTLLNLPSESSKEEVKAAFLEWKKGRQKILVSGTPAEQKLTIEEMTRVTALYKKFIGESEKTSSPPKTKMTTEHSSVVDAPNQSNPNQKLVTFTCVFAILVLSGLGFNALKDSSGISNPFKSANTPITTVEEPKPLNRQLQEKVPIEPQKTTETLPAPVEKTVEKPVDRNPGQTPNQRAAIQTLLDFHSGITNKNLRDAYNCLSMDFQNYMSYDGWTPGFATTVSSEVNDIKVVSESTNEIVLSYVLKATDNIQGNRQVSYFNGTVNIINENGLWKIDNIKNKVR